MIKINKVNNSLTVEGVDNVFYPNNGDNSYPLNSLIVVTDKSDMATFRSVATNDVLFSGLIEDITINGEAVTKDNIIQKFDAVSNSSTGGGTVDAYTKEEADNKFSTKDELTNVQTVANNADTKVDALTTRVEGVETSMDGKQDLLVSGTNIKTINNQSILGEGNIEITGGDVDLTNYYTKTEADGKFSTKDELTAVETVANNADTKADAAISRIESVETAMGNKQDTLVSGTNIKTINSQSILGSGDLAISGVSDEQAQEIAKIPTLETEIAQKANASDVPTVQNGLNGTNKNYVYSNADSSNYNDKVVSYCEFIANAPDRLDFFLYYWGDGGGSKFIDVPLATSYTAGIMSSNDKTKLDSIPENIQPTLVSGTNIKTINSQSILGEGNLEVTIPDATTAASGAMSAADKTKLDSISNEWTGTQSEYDALTTKDNNTIYYVTE